jgi:hypothetical protein
MPFRAGLCPSAGEENASRAHSRELTGRRLLISFNHKHSDAGIAKALAEWISHVGSATCGPSSNGLGERMVWSTRMVHR